MGRLGATMYQVTYIDRTGVLHVVNTPNKDTAASVFLAMFARFYTVRLWECLGKGKYLQVQ